MKSLFMSFKFAGLHQTTDDNDLLSVDRRLNSVIVRNEVDYTGLYGCSQETFVLGNVR